MDSSQRGKMLSAKEMTEEIDRATDAAAGVDLAEGRNGMGFSDNAVWNAQGVGVTEVTDAQAQALGRGAIFGRSGNEVPMNGGYETPTERAFGQIENTGEASVEAAAELSEVENEMANPEVFVGLASDVEVEERARQDWETAENEADPGRSRIAEIEYKNQEAVAKGVAPEVEKMLHEKSFELAGLLELYREGRNKTLDVVNHPIGKDN